MKLIISETPVELGEKAAELTAQYITQAINANGKARIILSTGASQFETLQALVQKDLEWDKVEMFHLDEYVGLSIEHIASFRKYLQERVVDQVGGKMKVHFVNGEGNIEENIKYLTEELRKEPIDVALIGIGENAHIAFNDPPADFDTKEAYIVVNLDEACKNQQVGEGWFATLDDVPKQAISMTVHQIMQSRVIISAVPHQVKAKAIYDTLHNSVTNLIPSTKLKEHQSVYLLLDKGSASLLPKE